MFRAWEEKQKDYQRAEESPNALYYGGAASKNKYGGSSLHSPREWRQ